MKQISSAHNPTIKHLRKLATSASYRRDTGQTVLDGVHLCQSYLQAGLVPQHVIVASDPGDEITSLLAQLSDTVEHIELPTSLFVTVNTVEHGVGILFVIDIPTPPYSDVDQSALLLDTVQDPGNLGTMLRTAAAAGMRSVYLSGGTANAWSPKALRAGMGAHFVMTIHQDVDLVQCVQVAQVPVYATSLQARRSLYEHDIHRDSAWLFGSEGRGVSPELIALCGDHVVTIPQDTGVESLNVAAAAAICLFEQRRQTTAVH